MSLRRTILRPVAFVGGMHASGQARQFIKSHRESRQVQDRLLRELVSSHVETSFGKDHAFSTIRCYEDFKRAVPVGSYETLRRYVRRVLDGETTALIPPGEQVLMFSMTSGTTGDPKYIPVTRRFLSDMRRGWNIFGMMTLGDHKDGWLRRILQIISPMCETRSPTGIACGAISGLLAATQKRIVRRMYVVPAEVFPISDPQAKYYAILRCGVGRNVGVITTANPSSTIKLIETGQQHVERLIRDVTDGTINPPGEFDPSRIGSLRFKPDRRLGARLQRCVERDGRLLPRHFWNLAFLTNWTGGTLGLYIPRLRELFGDVPIRDIGLVASEGRFSIPIEDGTSAGLADITSSFLEFIPADERESDTPSTLRLDEIEVGQEYFLVTSNWAGLWRYNIDDRIRVVDRFGDSPVFEFLCRGVHTANITGEKITEHQVVEAMREVSQRAGVLIDRFVVQGRFTRTPYYELRMDQRDGWDLEQLASLFDEQLQKLNMEYSSKRKSGRLAPVHPVALTPDTLEHAELENIRLHRNRSEQYKHQYLMTEVLAEK